MVKRGAARYGGAGPGLARQGEARQGKDNHQPKETTMGHFLFCILHLMALLFGVVGLFITIPLHLIYAALKKRR